MPLRIVLDRTDELADMLPAAIDAGLLAAGEIYKEAMHDVLLGGYTTGEYVTGQAANSVEVGERGPSDDGERSITVSSPLDYVAFWEDGFIHAGNGKFYQNELWKTTLAERSGELMDAYAAAVLEALGES